MIITVQGNGETALSPANGFKELREDLSSDFALSLVQQLPLACRDPGLTPDQIQPTNNAVAVLGFSFGGRIATQIVWDLLSPAAQKRWPNLRVSLSLVDPVWWDPGHETDEQTQRPEIVLGTSPRIFSADCYLRTNVTWFWPYHSRLASPWPNYDIPRTWHTTVLKQPAVRSSILQSMRSVFA